MKINVRRVETIVSGNVKPRHFKSKYYRSNNDISRKYKKSANSIKKKCPIYIEYHFTDWNLLMLYLSQVIFNTRVLPF